MMISSTTVVVGCFSELSLVAKAVIDNDSINISALISAMVFLISFIFDPSLSTIYITMKAHHLQDKTKNDRKN